jgi:hypothetical protein
VVFGGVFGGGAAERTCTVPEDREIFFPVANAINFDTPNVCGQGATSFTIEELRGFSAALIEGITSVSVELDGEPVKQVRRVRSEVFDIAVPEDNVFDSVCAGLGGLPAGVYSPAVDEGFYVLLKRLEVGTHLLHFSAEGQGFFEDVTYTLNVVPVLLK